ncbi:hypothetical protein SAMN05192529_13122 [Arachidicoccus rhizosphaerae]|uniref:Phage gp6-like head-tail connector protein n=1 Tax=Arachidicoccus rhizosphaerae TaxID=551991 RepID=A0A1H4CFE2_9BACT|nr:phage gp6-like head-tail connector protein [Arachidicoccus rhizosphaerae]SEA59050.1 hypothetical protein SAMN05192529_13122 [Arachidicoccus rhizosphaerae]
MSNLISKSIKPKSTDLPVTAAEVKTDLRVDYPLTDTQIENYIRSSIQRIQNLTCLVLVPSEVTTIYKQYGCGDQVSLGYANDIKPDTLEGTDGTLIGAGEQWYLQTTEQLVTLKYDAGYETLPDWARQAIILDVAWRLEHYGDDETKQYSPEMMALIEPFKAYIPI